jgi:hypothetical protein
MNLITSNPEKTVKDMSKQLNKVIKMISKSNKIQDSSSTLMSFLVDDLLDFA